MTELWLVRHGQTDWNLEGRWQGQAPDAPGLNANGYAQMLALCNQLPPVNFSTIYSSPLLRARQTAEFLASPLGLSITLDSRLREINLGVWEGMLSADIQKKYPKEISERRNNPLHSRPPQGESVADVAARVTPAITDIVTTHPTESVIIVGHGVTLGIMLCLAQGIPLEQVYEHIPENAKFYRVDKRS